jgi:hypothetical protein
MVESPTIWSEMQPGKYLLGVALLWRRLSDQLRKESSRKHRVRSKLHPEWEIDNFSNSHRCTSYVRPWSGARSVCQHLRVPLLLFSLSRFLGTSTPVMFLLVLFELFYVFLGPESDFEAIQRLDRRSFNFAIYNPAVESAPADADHLRHFNCREFRHRYNEIGLFHLSSTKSH